MKTFGSNTLVTGLQFGDEGKAKVIDYLLGNGDYQVVVRYQGGRNAGHTLWFGDQQVILHAIPSGITHDGIYNVIFSGCYFDPLGTLEEIRELEGKGYSVSPENLGISGRVQLTFDYHFLQEEAMESLRGKDKVGTTKRGISPTAMDITGRMGIRLAEFCGDNFESILVDTLKQRAGIFGHLFDEQPDPERIMEKYGTARKYFTPFIIDESQVRAERCHQNWLFECAQGLGIDVLYGTVPFVTSSSPVAVPGRVSKRLGVMKAFYTRVGEGPRIGAIGGEREDNVRGERETDRTADFGATSGRPRSCCWFDAVWGRYAVTVAETDSLAVTKIDKLDGVNPVRACVGYKYKNDTLSLPPSDRRILAQCEPVYKEFPGWPEGTSSRARNFRDLHPNEIAYLRWLQDTLETTIELVSVGPEAKQTIEVSNNL